MILGDTEPVETVFVAKEPGEFLVQTSFPPDIVDAGEFTWTADRMSDADADTGIFLTTSTPTAQQQSDYRIFISGVLVGLAGALLVAVVALIVGHRRRS